MHIRAQAPSLYVIRIHLFTAIEQLRNLILAISIYADYVRIALNTQMLCDMPFILHRPSFMNPPSSFQRRQERIFQCELRQPVAQHNHMAMMA